MLAKLLVFICVIYIRMYEQKLKNSDTNTSRVIDKNGKKRINMVAKWQRLRILFKY